jgi:hypothetical protein
VVEDGVDAHEDDLWRRGGSVLVELGLHAACFL